MLKTTNIMVDLETGGTNSERSPIIQIGAVRFDQFFNIEDEFSIALTVPQDREWSRNTYEWWQKTDPALLLELEIHPNTYGHALTMFSRWLPNDATLWAWPTGFDMNLLHSYAKAYHPSLVHRLNRRNWVDSASFIQGLTAKYDVDLNKIYQACKGDTHVHHAMEDAAWQVRCLRDVINEVDELDANDTRL